MGYCCGRYFEWDDELEQHEINNHWSRCPHCTLAYKFSNDLDDHIDADHTVRHFCQICPSLGRTSKAFRSGHALDQHVQNASGHENWCYKCKRGFINPNALQQHTMGSAHNGRCVKCPACIRMFSNVTGVCVHLESGKCESGITRRQVDDFVRKVDRNNVITKKLLTYDTRDQDIRAGEDAWNGYGFECCLCPKQFRSLQALNQHLNSGVHEADKYHCPKCRTDFRLLSSLVNHLSSGTCGQVRFRMGKDGISGMVGRLINC